MDRIVHPLARQFAHRWQALRSGRLAPSRADIDPFELKPFLPNLFMIDVVRPAMRFKARLVGTAVVEAVGADNTGKWADEVTPPQHYADVRQELMDVVENAVIRYSIADLAWQGRPYARYHRLYMPLSADQRQIDIVVGIIALVRSGEAKVPPEPLAAAIETEAVQLSRIKVAC